MRVATGPRGLNLSIGRSLRLVVAGLTVGLATVCVAVLPVQVAGAATDTVTNCNDSGPGSLPVVVAGSAAGDTVTLAPTPSCTLITLAATIDITTDLTIVGPGAGALAVSGGGTVGVFDVASGVTASISGLTIEDGNAAAGGGIDNSGTLDVAACTVSGNNALSGGGILNDGTLTVTGSTISGNDASDGSGGGIANLDTATVTGTTLSGNSANSTNASYVGAPTYDDPAGGGIDDYYGFLTVTASTVSGNSANGNGGGISTEFGAMIVMNSTLSGNGATASGGGIYNYGIVIAAASIVADSTSGGDCANVRSIRDARYNLDDDGSCGFSSTSHSLSDVDPELGLLEDNGGPTETQAPAADSPVLNQIPPGTMADSTTLCPGTDQRGVARPQGTKCDIGALELVVPQAITSADKADATVRRPFAFTVTTTGNPVPTVAERGKLPSGLTFSDVRNGTGIISGRPTKAGVFHLKLLAIFRKDETKNVVAQAFILNVAPAS
jgi:hypothetical protein